MKIFKYWLELCGVVTGILVLISVYTAGTFSIKTSIVVKLFDTSKPYTYYGKCAVVSQKIVACAKLRGVE